MVKTTVYLPDDTKRSLERLAGELGRSEADLIREAVDTLVRGAIRPRPRGGVFSSDDPMLFGANVEEALKGFGEL